MVKQKHANFFKNTTVLNIATTEGNKEIKNQIHSRILGLNLQQDLSWKSHLELGQKPLLRPVSTKKSQTGTYKWFSNVKDHLYDSSLGGCPKSSPRQDLKNYEQISQIYTKWWVEMEHYKVNGIL